MSLSTPPPPPTQVLWSEDLMGYHFSESHPMHPSRLDLTMRMIEGLGILERDNISLLAPRIASVEELATVHDRDYIAAVQYAGEHPGEVNEERGLGTEDDPVFADIHAASARLAGGSLQAADAVLAGRALHVVNFAGGMHHASRGRASGFCIYNDAALAIQRLLDGGV
ncbi:MAG TPA: acetoin utilization protein AcuC, partial [Arthrobacter sp.]|nr:acetoin utilization protein AcuC [Arthrobacter sp.]